VWPVTRPDETRLPVTERRDPTAALITRTNQTVGLAALTGLGDRAVTHGFDASPFVFRGVQRIADAVASLPIRVGPDPDRPMVYDRSHPAAVMLGPA
jgi:hypothetical protein